MEQALDKLCLCVKNGQLKTAYIPALSDRDVDQAHAAIPALLGTSAVHHFLTREGSRTELAWSLKPGEAREVHHFALLAAYGAEAINPYLAFDTLSGMCASLAGLSEYEAHKRYIKATSKGLFKVMSKMGISTYQSYCGAQIFNAIGLAETFFWIVILRANTTSTTEGAGLSKISQETLRGHQTGVWQCATFS